MEINVHAGWCNRLSFLDKQIWLPLDNVKAINVYTQDGKLDSVIETGEKSIAVVRKALNGDIICGGDSGLFVTNHAFSEASSLQEGKFSDIVVHQNKVSALDYENASVHTFYIIFNALQRWREFNFFRIGKLVNNSQFKLGYNSTILVTKNDQFVIASMSKQVAIFSFTGECLYVETLSICPSICQVDENGQLLIANSVNCDFFTLYPSLNAVFTLQKTLNSIQSNKCLYVLADGENNVWILSVANQGLIKISTSSLNICLKWQCNN